MQWTTGTSILALKLGEDMAKIADMDTEAIEQAMEEANLAQWR